MREQVGAGFYMVYFQQPGVAEAEFDHDHAETFRRMLCATSGQVPIVPDGGGFLDLCPEPDEIPDWLTEDDIAVYAGEYADSGFAGPLNWYRNLDRNCELTAAWHRAPIKPPALFIAGDRDPLIAFPKARERIDRMSDFLPDLRDIVWLRDGGHLIQQERPTEVNEALIGFLRAL